MYQRFTCVGRTTADAKRQKAKQSDVEYTTFAVAVNEGKDKVTFFDVTVFGEKGKPVADNEQALELPASAPNGNWTNDVVVGRQNNENTIADHKKLSWA